jgi:hypothetical protein
LFEGGFEVFDDLLGENVGVGRLSDSFQAFVSEPADVEAGFFLASCNYFTPSLSK